MKWPSDTKTLPGPVLGNHKKNNILQHSPGGSWTHSVHWHVFRDYISKITATSPGDQRVKENGNYIGEKDLASRNNCVRAACYVRLSRQPAQFTVRMQLLSITLLSTQDGGRRSGQGCLQRLFLTSMHASNVYPRPSDSLHYVGFTGVMCSSVGQYCGRNRAV